MSEKRQRQINEGVVGKVLDLTVTYKFLRQLTTPFKKTKAYKLGVLDANGNLTKKRKEMSKQEKAATGVFNRLVWKVKRMMSTSPLGASKLASYATALWFIKESEDFRRAEQAMKKHLRLNNIPLCEDKRPKVEKGYYITNTTIYGLDDQVLAAEGTKIYVGESYDIILGQKIYTGVVEHTSFPILPDNLSEEIANMVSTGNVALPEQPLMKSCKHGKFMGCDVFDVDGETYSKCVRGKKPKSRYKKYVGDGDDGDEIRLHGRSRKPIILRHKDNGSMIKFKD